MPVNAFDQYPLTWKPDKSKLQPPYYRALAEDLEQKIRSGQLQAGTKLPPQREIADYLDLNYTTITRVYDICKKKGLIYGTTGRGTFVAPHAGQHAAVTETDEADGAIELGVINGFGEYSDLVEKATSAVVARGYLRNLYEYSQPTGHPHQLAAGVRWMEQLGTHTDAAHTAIFSGAQNALTVALMALFSPGDKIAVDKYTYPNFIELAKLLHLVLIPVDMDEQGMLPAALQKQCASNKLKGIYLIPTCANPTAITMPLERRKALAEIIRRNGLILIEDDIVAWMLAAGGQVLPSMFDIMGGESVYICGMTKSLCPGLRIAYMTYGEAFRERILHALVNVNIKTSSFDAEVITELILNGDAYQITRRKYELAEKTCRLYDRYFPDHSPNSEAVSYYKWIPIRTDAPAEGIEGELLERGVHIYHSSRFVVGTEEPRAYLRVALCSAGSARKLERGLKILKGYLTEKGYI
ncbi:MAG: PLP-dependent aminotransferase family protein [Oscillospiraceae bacterium]|nr:PLP-dependent aminotransferase family protein [Oscillospiraceae bacterium]